MMTSAALGWVNAASKSNSTTRGTARAKSVTASSSVLTGPDR